MPIPGKMEITVKTSEFPEAQDVENGWKNFIVLCDPYEISITLRPKFFKQFKDKTEAFPMWVAAIRSTMGALTEKGFILENPNVQVFEKKPKSAEPSEQAPS